MSVSKQDSANMPMAFVMVFFFGMAFVLLSVAFDYIGVAVFCGVALVLCVAAMTAASGAVKIELKNVQHNQSTSGKAHQPQITATAKPITAIDNNVIDGQFVKHDPSKSLALPAFKEFRAARNG